MAWAWEYPAASASQKLVLLALADHCDDDGQCFPGIERLVTKCGISNGQVRRHLDALETAGALDRTRRHRADGSLSTYLYTLTLDSPSAHQCAVGADDLARTDAQSERAPMHVPSAHLCARIEPSLEPSDESSARTRSKAKRATQVPGYDAMRALLSEAERAQARELYGAEAKNELLQFIDYHTARGSTMKDWRAAWRTWMRNATKFGTRKTASAAATTDVPNFADSPFRQAQGAAE